MPRYLCKLEDQYFEWSTIVDAPTTFGMTREEMEEYHREEYGVSADAELARRLARVDATGCSARDGTTVDDLIAHNRAGPNESALTREELLRYLKKGRGMKDCPWCHIDPNEIAALKQRVAELERELAAARKVAKGRKTT